VTKLPQIAAMHMRNESSQVPWCAGASLALDCRQNSGELAGAELRQRTSFGRRGLGEPDAAITLPVFPPWRTARDNVDVGIAIKHFYWRVLVDKSR
jgi:hypothetical protein